jgi:hypothetical protein
MLCRYGARFHTTPGMQMPIQDSPMRQWQGLATHRRYISRCLDPTFVACRHEIPGKGSEGGSQRTGRNSGSGAAGLAVETNPKPRRKRSKR